jgi:hypothetical protein
VGPALEQDDFIRWSEVQILIPTRGREQSSTDIPTRLLERRKIAIATGTGVYSLVASRRGGQVNSSAAACGCSRTE